jgi:P-type Mg2+ transporter
MTTARDHARWIGWLPGSARTARTPGPTLRRSLQAYWTLEIPELADRLKSSSSGLTSTEARQRLDFYGPNTIREQDRVSRLTVLGRQLRSPLLLLLVFAAGASVLTGEWLDAAIVMTIVFASVAVGYHQEYRGETAAASLRARLRTRTTVVRDGRESEVPIEDVVPGDVVLLRAGTLVPADAVLVDSTDCYVSEAVLTGESFPVLKAPAALHADAQLRERTNCVFLGTNVRSGTARCLAVATGRATEFGRIAQKLALRPPETEFDRGVRRFGYSLTTAMLILILVVFVAHALAGRAVVETLLFSVALAVGLSPELLPAILNVNLARGAQAMAEHGVLVRHLNAIENLGSMDVLCTDKTGTITEGVVRLEGAYDASGQRSDQVLELAACNAALESGIASVLDDAIASACKPDISALRKVGEIPFDFVRKRVTVATEDARGIRLVMKGAFRHVLEVCTRTGDGSPMDDAQRRALEKQYELWSACGTRVLAVATRCIGPKAQLTRDHEQDMAFMGFLTFSDRPKEGVADAIAALARLGVSIKVITGDSDLVARHVATAVGLRADRVLTGRQLDELHDEALWRLAEQTDLFVEVDPNQKERIILSLKKMGHVVGFLGDGVNDAPAMHAADTSLSVEHAVDVARQAADFVLLERGLDVIRRGIEEGRRTFANTLKYVLITTSANLGNMVSMAAASLFLPFLPLTAGQILLNNFLSDVPAVGIASDAVDDELISRPRRWDMRFIRRFMIEFGMLSSAFDFLTFGALLWIFRATPAVFQTSWFVESLLTELVIALVVRTRRRLFESRPGTLLLLSTIALIPVAFAIPYVPFAGLFGFEPLPARLVGTIATITILYVFATELLKRRFYLRPDSSSR